MLLFESLITVPTHRFGNIELYFTAGGRFLWVNRQETSRDTTLRQLLGEPEGQKISPSVKSTLIIERPEISTLYVGGKLRSLGSLVEEIYLHNLQTGSQVLPLRTTKDVLHNILSYAINYATGIILGMLPQLNSSAATAYHQGRRSQCAEESSPKAYALAIHERFSLVMNHHA